MQITSRWENKMDKYCMCKEIGAVLRDGKSTCSKCGGRDAYGSKSRRRINEMQDFPIGKDLNWNCLAITKYGEQCKCFRKYGKFCKRHLEHYIKYKEQEEVSHA